MKVDAFIRDLTATCRSGQLSSSQAERLESALADYLESLERGDAPDTSAVIAEHPDLAEELRENLAKIAALHRAAASMTDGGGMLDQLCGTSLAEHRTLGDFRLIRPIGRGGMGLVYEAEQASLNRRVALKTIPLAAVLDPKQLARFKNEAQAAASLDHPHIVSVYANGSDRGVHYYAMQYIDGLSLAEAVDLLREATQGLPTGHRGKNEDRSRANVERTDAPFTTPAYQRDLGFHASSETRCIASLTTERSQRPADYFRSVARIGVQAAAALHYAHEMGVVHRDVKPSNQLLDNDGRLYVADFGLAMTQTNSQLTMTGDLLGTLRYMSPEQASGRRALIDRRTDVYSLGASLYELATLQPAFPEDDRARLLVQIAAESPPLPTQINRDVPQDLETVILKAMAKDPANRYETSKELADDLARFVELKPIRARRITRLEHVRSWCRRNKAMASLLGAVMALSAVLSIGGPIVAIKQAQLAESQAQLADSQAQLVEEQTQLAREKQEELNAKNINQLYQDWYSGNVERVDLELKRHFAAADSSEFLFEWELLRQQYADSKETVFYRNENRESNLLTFVKFSPRGDLIACGQPGDRVAIYDVNEKSLRPLENDPEGGAADAVFSRDGNELITVSRSGIINRRDVVTGKVVGPVIHCGAGDRRVEWVTRYHSIHLSRDGSTVVVAMENEQSAFLVVVRLGDGACTRIATHDGNISTCALSPIGAMIVTSGEDGLIKFWDLQGNPLHQPRPCSYAMDIQFTPDGQKLVICDYANGVSILDAATLEQLPGLRGEQRYVSRLAVSREDLLATVGIDNRIVLWDLRTGNRVTSLVGHAGDIWDLAFSPDGTSLASAAADATLRLWPLGTTLGARDDPAAVFQWWRTDLQFDADGKSLISCARPNAAPAWIDVDTQMIKWETATGDSEKIVPQGRHGRCDLAAVPGTELLLCGGPGEFSLKNRTSGEVVDTLHADALYEYQQVTVSSDGKWAAGCGHILKHPRQAEYLASRPQGPVCFVAICMACPIAGSALGSRAAGRFRRFRLWSSKRSLNGARGLLARLRRTRTCCD